MSKNVSRSNFSKPRIAARKIYGVALFVLVMVSLVLYRFKDEMSATSLIGTLLVLSVLLIACIHGIIAYSFNPGIRESWMVYPIAMGASYTLLFFLFMCFILPVCRGEEPGNCKIQNRALTSTFGAKTVFMNKPVRSGY